MNIFKLFSKKEEIQEFPKQDFWNLRIEFKTGKQLSYSGGKSIEDMPDEMNDLIWWFHKFKTETYLFRYKGGLILFNRSDILFINLWKKLDETEKE